MSKARTVRKLINFAGMALALAAMLQEADFGKGLAWSIAILALTYTASQMAFAGLASDEERRRDLENRKA